MIDLHLKPTQCGTGVRLHPADHSFFKKVNGLWIIIPDEGVPSDIAAIIFNAYHGLKMREYLTAEKLCMYINTFLTGKRLVLCNGVRLDMAYNGATGLLSTSRTVPVLRAGEVNTLAIDSLLNTMGLIPTNAGKLTAWYDAAIGEYGCVRVYLAGVAHCTIECEVK